MKIGILTQPLHTNYGGLIQAFALQRFLRGMGHDALMIDYARRERPWLAPYRFARRCVGKFLLGRGGALFPKPLAAGTGRYTARFVAENIRTTQKIFAPARARDFAEYAFDAFVVGSDQTWRPVHTAGCDPIFLGDFPTPAGTRKIVYAASAGAASAALEKLFPQCSVVEETKLENAVPFNGGLRADSLKNSKRAAFFEVFNAAKTTRERVKILEKFTKTPFPSRVKNFLFRVLRFSLKTTGTLKLAKKLLGK